MVVPLATIAGLPDCSACVRVSPPLNASASSIGSSGVPDVPTWSKLTLLTKTGPPEPVPAIPIKLCPSDATLFVAANTSVPVRLAMFSAMIVFCTVPCAKVVLKRLIIDDFGHWQGARRAVEEYFAATRPSPLLNVIDYTGRIGIKPG